MEKNALVRKQLSRRSFLHAAAQVDLDSAAVG